MLDSYRTLKDKHIFNHLVILILYYLIFFTLLVTGVDLITLILSSKVIFFSFNNPVDYISMLWIDPNSYYFIAYLIFNGLMSAYVLIFGSRLRGLIFPKSLKTEENADLKIK